MNTPSIDLLLQIDTGVDAGAVYQITGAHLRIGRADDNDIVLSDPKVSRYHASIELKNHNLVIKNISTTQDIKVDNQSVQNEAFLHIGSSITIGTTVIRLVQESAIAENNKDSSPIATSNSNNKKNPLFYIYIVLGGLFAYLLLSEDTKETPINELRDEKAIQEEIAESQKITEALQNAKYTSGKDSKQYLDAQESYLKGFRDYREGNYSRAITSFEAALALYPKHPLAKHYLNLSRRKLDEKIQVFMQEGNRFMDKGKYSFAISSFKNAMILIKDPSDPNYKEAYAKYKQSKAIIEESF